MDNKDDVKSTLNETLTDEFLIKYGYFSFKRRVLNDEYHCVESDIFSKHIWGMDDLLNLLNSNPQIVDSIKKSYTEGKLTSTEPAEIHVYKSEYTKRKFKFINMYNYLQLSYFLIDNKEEFIPLFYDDIHSTSKFFLSSFKQNDLRKKKDIKTKGKRIILKTDLSQFYPSLYTHTIPWVFMGKEKAKKDRRGGFANQLDKLVQNAQHSETKGIPTGSFISKLIAEIYQLKIDKEIKKELDSIPFHRYCDDYQFYLDNEIDSENVLRVIYNVYSKYELQINESKVKVVEFPDIEKETKKLNLYFDKIWGRVSSIINSDESLNKKAKKIAVYIYDYIELYLVTKKTTDLKLPIYFPLVDFLKSIGRVDDALLKYVLKMRFLTELVNVFLIDLKYLQYFMNFVEEFYSEPHEKVLKETFGEYQETFNIKLQYYFNNGYQVELSHILTLNLVFPYFLLESSTLLEVIKESDAITSLMSLKILMRASDTETRSKCIESAFKRIVEQGDFFEFNTYNFMLEYEIARMYKNNELDSYMTLPDGKKIKKRIDKLSNSLPNSTNNVDELKKFYFHLLENNVKFFIKE